MLDYRTIEVLEELVGFEARYLAAKEQWGAVLSELTQQALSEEEPEKIARFLREKSSNVNAQPTGLLAKNCGTR